MSGDAGQHRARTARLLAAALAALALIAIAMVYGPQLVSGNYHRAAIERLATDALGRRVTIAGPIELSILPEPQLRAETITVGSPKGGLITAATLKLDLAPLPLLLGRLRATKLTLRKPVVTLPWPLPGGAASVAPPPWLASLHATIVDGRFRLGGLILEHADLSIFTGGPNAVLAASGSAVLNGRKCDVTLDLADTGGDAPAPVTGSLVLDADRSARLDFKGTIDREGIVAGALAAQAPGAALAAAGFGKALPPASVRAELVVSGALVALRDIDGTIGVSRIGGRAIMALDPAPLVRLDLTGRDWSLGRALDVLRRHQVDMPMAIAATIDIADSSFDGIGFQSLNMSGGSDRSGRFVQSLMAGLPGGGRLTLAGARFRVTAPDPNATIAGLRPALPELPNWPDRLGALEAAGRFAMRGDDVVALDGVTGRIGGPKSAASAFTGALRVGIAAHEVRIASRLGFDRLVLSDRALASLVAGVRRLNGAIVGPFEIRARRVVVRHRDGAKVVTRFAGDTMMLDGALRGAARGGGIAIDLATLRLGRALLVGHGAETGNGGIVASRLLLTGPDAGATLRDVVPLVAPAASWLGLGVLHHRYAAALVAAGPAASVHAGLTVHLGTMRAAVLPVIDLVTGTASGPLSFHAPDAAMLIDDSGGGFLLDPARGLAGGPAGGPHPGLGWPGAGSASLRAFGFVTPERVGLSDFVLSLGALTASGQVSLLPQANPLLITGSIAGDTLAIPATRTLVGLADAGLAEANGAHPIEISLKSITASRIVQEDHLIARDASLDVALTPGRDASSLSLGVDRQAVAGGVLDGTAVLTAPHGAAPDKRALNLAFHLRHADAAKLAATLGVTPPFTAGTIDVASVLKAQGDTVTLWRRSLAGHVTASGTGIAMRGVDLAAAGQALGQAIAAQKRADAGTPVREKLIGGTTAFDSLSLDASVAAGGAITLAHARLAGPDGTLAARGTIDPLRRSMNLSLTAQPTVRDAGSTVAGPAFTMKLAGTPGHILLTPHGGTAKGWVAARAAHGGP